MEIKRVIGSIVQLIKRLRSKVVPVMLYHSGTGKSNRLTAVFVGWDLKLRNYWLQTLFGNDYRRKKSLFVPARNISSWVLKNKSIADVAIVDSETSLDSPGVGHVFLLPKWMEFEIDIGESLQKSRVKEILRRIRKNSITYELRGQEKDLDFFYHGMYKPLISKNHGNSAELATYAYFHKKFKENRLEIMFLNIEGKPVAGSLLERGDGYHRILAFGVLEGNKEIIKKGVHAAAYYYTMVQLRDEGVDTMRCGSAKPLPLDGVTQFKLRMGARPFRKDLETRKKYNVVFLDHSTRVMDMMKVNPIYHLAGKDLELAIFTGVDGFRKSGDFARYLKLLGPEYVDRINCYVPHNGSNIGQWIKNGEVPPVTLVDYV